MTTTCPLCAETGAQELETPRRPGAYLHCGTCDLRFLRPELRLSIEEEEKRYRLHKNDPSDEGYQKFLGPLYREIVSRVGPSTSILDFGAGEASVLSSRLRDAGFTDVTEYDVYFHRDTLNRDSSFDLIFASEVIEHFRNPREEFQRLRKALRPGGTLVLMTLIYSQAQDFDSWTYRRDPTHIAFYSKETLQWIAQAFHFSSPHFVSERICVLN